MAYDERLAQRLRDSLNGETGLSERKMFGGIAFMLQGNMCCGVLKTDLLAQIHGTDTRDGYKGHMEVRPVLVVDNDPDIHEAVMATMPSSTSSGAALRWL